MGRTACTELQCLYSTAIPLLPLCAVRPVESLSACTVQLYLYSPYGPYGLYRASVPLQYSYTSTPPMGLTVCTEPQCLYSTALPLLPLWAVRSVQSLCACTVQLNLYSPQCLYSTAIPLLPSVPCTVQLYLYSPQCLYSTAIPLLHSVPCTVQLYLYSPQYLYITSTPLLPSVPVQYSYTSTPLSACTVQLYLYSPQCPVQYSYTSTPLSAYTVQLYLYSPYGPYSLYRASVPVQGCTLTFFLLVLINEHKERVKQNIYSVRKSYFVGLKVFVKKLIASQEFQKWPRSEFFFLPVNVPCTQ